MSGGSYTHCMMVLVRIALKKRKEKEKYKTQNTKLCEAFDCVLCSLFVGRAFGRCLCLYVAVGFSPCTSFLCFCFCFVFVFVLCLKTKTRQQRRQANNFLCRKTVSWVLCCRATQRSGIIIKTTRITTMFVV